VFHAVSAVSFARECVRSVWSDLADSNLLVSRSFGWRLRFLPLAVWVVSAILCSTLENPLFPAAAAIIHDIMKPLHADACCMVHGAGCMLMYAVADAAAPA
jgi:hypothetical protein